MSISCLLRAVENSRAIFDVQYLSTDSLHSPLLALKELASQFGKIQRSLPVQLHENSKKGI